jgi:hypothetical protein
MKYGNTETHIPIYVAEKNEQDAKIKGFIYGFLIGAALTYICSLFK